MPTVGAGPLGSLAFAGEPLLDPPEVAITSPLTGVIAPPGPNILVSWDYSQAQGVAQSSYRVRFLSGADAELWSSGWLAGDDASMTVSVTTLGLPGNWSGKVEVKVRSTLDLSELSLARYEATDTVADVSLNWGVPSLVLTDPLDGGVHADPAEMDVVWTFADTLAGAQGSYRAQLVSPSTLSVLFDTGWTVSASGTIVVPYVFTDGQQVIVQVRATNVNGIRTDWSQVTVLVQLADVVDVEPDPLVGTVYEVGIQGRGYMLFDSPEREYQYRRTTIGLEVERFATGDTPFSQSLDRYSFYSQADWTGGAGQRWGSRLRTDPSMWWRSDGVDPFSCACGSAKLLNATEVWLADVTRFVVCGPNVLAQTGAKAFSWWNGTSWATFTIDAATTVTSLAWDGTYWYAAAGAQGIFRGTVAVDPGAAWSAITGATIDWAADRIVAVTTGGAFTPLTPAGAEETTGGLRTLSAGVKLGGSASGFYFMGHGRSVWAWKQGLNEAGNQFVPFVALDLDPGETIQAVDAAGGAVWVRTQTGSEQRLWRCVVDGGGGLTPFLVASWTAATQTGGFAAYGDMVFFSYKAGGLGAVYLPTGGWASWVKAAALPDAVVAGVGVFDGDPVFLTDGDLYRLSANLVASGYIDLSTEDAGSGLDKVWDELTVIVEPLGAGVSVTLSYSTDQGESYIAMPAITTAGVTSRTLPLGVKSPTLSLRATLTGTGAVGPGLRVFQGKYHPLGTGDTVLILPVLCADQVAGLNGKPIPESGPGSAARTSRRLQELSQTRVLVQDVDWMDSSVSEVFEVVNVDLRRIAGIREAAKRGQAQAFVAVVTLRRVGVSS